MKLNKKVVSLINEGFKAKTLKGFTDNQINQLYERVIGKKENKEGVTTQVKQTKVTTVDPATAKKESIPVQNGTVGIDPQTNNLVVKSQLNQSKPEKKKNKVIKDANIDEINVDVVNDPDATEDGMGMFESKKKKKKVNPWAICTDSVGREDKEKYEKCVQDIKKKNKGNITENLFLEEKILNLVQKYVEPKMTKKDFISLIESKKESAPTTKPKEPTTKPGTKTPPKEKPFDPFKPSPSKQPNPKAKKKEEAKESAPTTKPKEPTTKPGTKTPPKEKPFDPFKPSPSKQPNPKAKKKVPEWLSFNKLGIKFK